MGGPPKSRGVGGGSGRRGGAKTAISRGSAFKKWKMKVGLASLFLVIFEWALFHLVVPFLSNDAVIGAIFFSHLPSLFWSCFLIELIWFHATFFF